MKTQYVKSNSVIVAVDFPGDENRGLAFVGLTNGFGVSVSAQRNSARQIGSQKLASNEVSLSPDIGLSLSFVPTKHFSAENLFGLDFNFNPKFSSIFKGKSEQWCNVYLFLSDKQSSDFIDQINQQETLNGVVCFCFGNCYLTTYGISFQVADLIRSQMSLVSSNMEASIVSNDRVKKPTVNFENGQISSDYLLLDWPQIRLALEELTKENQSVLPFTEAKFSCSLGDLDIPGPIISPLKDAKIQSLDLQLNIERETSYSFGSNFPRGRKIKFPVQCDLSLSTIVGQLNSGVFSGWMGGESRYNAEIQFVDPTDLFLSGKSAAELSSFYDTNPSGVTGFFTDSRCLRLESGRLNSFNQSSEVNGLLEASVSLSFQCDEDFGFKQRFGLNNGSQPWYYHTPEAQKLYDSSGNLLAGDNYLYIYGEDCSRNHVIDGDGNLLLCNNWSEQENPCNY